MPANGAKTPIVVQAVDIRSSAAARNLICSRSASVTLLHSPGARGASNRNRKARARTLKSKKRPQPRGRCWGRHAAGRLSRFPERRNAGPVPIAAACFDPQCPPITKTERPRSANLLQMPRGLMCKLRQCGREYGGPAGSRGIDPSLQPLPLRSNCWGRPFWTGGRLNPNSSPVCPACDIECCAVRWPVLHLRVAHSVSTKA